MGTRHMLGIRAVLAARVAALVGGHPLAAMEDLDHARGGANLDLGADQRMRNRVEEVVDLDVIVEVDARASPLGELPVVGGQRNEGVALDPVEQFAAAQAQLAHRPLVHALHGQRDRRVAFGEREESQPPQPPQNTGLGESDSGFDLRLVPRFSRTRRENSDAVMRGKRPIGAVDLGIVEGRLVDPGN